MGSAQLPSKLMIVDLAGLEGLVKVDELESLFCAGLAVIIWNSRSIINLATNAKTGNHTNRLTTLGYLWWLQCWRFQLNEVFALLLLFLVVSIFGGERGRPVH